MRRVAMPDQAGERWNEGVGETRGGKRESERNDTRPSMIRGLDPSRGRGGGGEEKDERKIKNKKKQKKTKRSKNVSTVKAAGESDRNGAARRDDENDGRMARFAKWY
jgi:hypothetical protein